MLEILRHVMFIMSAESSGVNVLRCVLLLMVVGAVIYSGTVDISF